MQFTTIITFLLAALLLFGCIATAENTGEKTPAAGIKNGTATAETSEKNTSVAYENKNAEGKNAQKEIAAENKTASNETSIANITFVSANATAPETSTANATAQGANVSQNASAHGIPVAYFYSLICPFCKNASIYVEELEQKYPIYVQKYEIYYNETNFNLFKQYAYEYRLKPDEFAVPTAFINSSYYVGPNIYEGLEKKIQNLSKETKK